MKNNGIRVFATAIDDAGGDVHGGDRGVSCVGGGGARAVHGARAPAAAHYTAILGRCPEPTVTITHPVVPQY